MIEATELAKRYRMGQETIEALRGVTLRIEEGESVAILGPSGSGKSTLMHLLGGLDTPSSGSIVVDGAELSRLDRRALARYRNEKVGFVFQSFHLQPHLSAIENVELPLKIREIPRAERRAQAVQCLTDVGLVGRMSHRPSQLSGGERQRVSVARAIAGNPKFILADEPTGNLDSKTGRSIMDLFLGLHQERRLTIVVVTHNPELAGLMSRAIHILDGQLQSAAEAASEGEVG